MYITQALYYCMYLSVYVYAYLCACVYVRVRARLHVYAYMCVCICITVCVCVPTAAQYVLRESPSRGKIPDGNHNQLPRAQLLFAENWSGAGLRGGGQVRREAIK